MSESGVIKVLLVEDDVRLAALTAEYLQGHELSVVIACDGSKALEHVSARQFDVVLLDLNLPGIDGIEVCRRIRERSSIPIVMLTARDELPDRVVGLDAGADDYLAKPYSSRELLSRIRAVVRRARGQVGPELSEAKVGRLRFLPDQLLVYLGMRPSTSRLTSFQYCTPWQKVRVVY